jgi:PKD repeat protein
MSDSDTLTATVSNAAPVVNAGANQTVNAGVPVNVNITFTDSGANDTHVATIDWGDGAVDTVDPATSPVAATHVYTAGAVYTVTATVTDNDGGVGQDTLTVTAEVPTLVGANYTLIQNNMQVSILACNFDKPVRAELTSFDMIGMDVDGDGAADIELSDDIGLRTDQTGLTNQITVDINRAFNAVKALVIAHFVQELPINIVLKPGAFTSQFGAGTLAQELALGMTPACGDVTGTGSVSALDAMYILQSTILGQTVFPVYDAASDLSALLKSFGHDVDVMTKIADVTGNGDVGAYDAAQALRLVAGKPMLAPSFGGGIKRLRLSVNECDGQRLEVSIDLSDVRDLYSADIVMTYDPSAMTLADVSKTSAISEWISADGVESGRLRVSLAGASQPVSDGSLITVSFEGEGLEDAISKVDIADVMLNGGGLRATIENLPKSFALMQNYPNPFNPETWIPYRLSKPADVSIIIYSMNGQMVRRLDLGSKMPGHYMDRSKAAYWDGRNESGELVSSGIYFYQLQAGHDASVRKMIIVK